MSMPESIFPLVFILVCPGAVQSWYLLFITQNVLKSRTENHNFIQMSDFYLFLKHIILVGIFLNSGIIQFKSHPNLIFFSSQRELSEAIRLYEANKEAELTVHGKTKLSLLLLNFRDICDFCLFLAKPFYNLYKTLYKFKKL